MVSKLNSNFMKAFSSLYLVPLFLTDWQLSISTNPNRLKYFDQGKPQ